MGAKKIINLTSKIVLPAVFHFMLSRNNILPKLGPRGKYMRLRLLCSDYHAVVHEAIVAIVLVWHELGFDLYTGKARFSY